jgi:hypothetical protein
MTDAPLRRRTSKRQKIISTTLAATTCLGVTGLIGISEIQKAQAKAQQDAPSSTGIQAASPAYDQVQLDVYKAQLDTQAAQLQLEALKLANYRDKLAVTAEKLKKQLAAYKQLNGKGQAPATTVLSVPSAVPSASKQKPVVAAPPKLTAPKAAAPKPHTTTKAS